MPLTFINIIGVIAVYAPFVIFCLYIIFAIYVLINKAYKIKEKIMFLITGFLIFVFSVFLTFVITWALITPRYNAWTKKCGQEPVIGVDGMFEPTKETTIGQNDAKNANKYFCSLKEAKQNGYNPR